MIDDPPRKKCKGLVFRYTSSTYLSKHGSIEVRQSLRLLKRQSCTGCALCGWVIDEIKEWIEQVDFKNVVSDFEDGDICKLEGKYSYPSSPYYDDGDADFWLVKI